MSKVFYLIMLTTSLVFSQEIIKVSNVEGVSYIYGNTTPNMAEKEALNDAKLNSLRKAGIGDYINSSETLFTSEINDNYDDFYSSEFTSQLNGAIKSYEIIDKRSEIVETGVKLTITINSQVIKYKTNIDSEFSSQIEGIQSVYKSDEKINFTVKTTKESYLTIFWTDQSDSGILYPNNREAQIKLKPNQTYTFPTDQSNYIASFSDETLLKETNRFLFVFTKKKRIFIHSSDNKQDIFSWVNSIELNDRLVKSFSYFVVK